MICFSCGKKYKKELFNSVTHEGVTIKIKQCKNCLPEEEAQEWYVENQLTFLKASVARIKRARSIEKEVSNLSKTQLQQLLDTEKFITPQGYFYRKYKSSRIMEHRLVCLLYDKEIPAGYVVHHIDENKKNNNPENLEVMTSEAHVKLHDNLKKGA